MIRENLAKDGTVTYHIEKFSKMTLFGAFLMLQGDKVLSGGEIVGILLGDCWGNVGRLLVDRWEIVE
jgi:hypothetical protein